MNPTRSSKLHPVERTQTTSPPELDEAALLAAARALSLSVGDDGAIDCASPEDLIERLFALLARATTMLFDAPTTAFRFGRAARVAIDACASSEQRVLASSVGVLVTSPCRSSTCPSEIEEPTMTSGQTESP